jgi:hypothetical protein
LGPQDWHLVLRLPEYTPRLRRAANVFQPLLFAHEEIAAVGPGV